MGLDSLQAIILFFALTWGYLLAGIGITIAGTILYKTKGIKHKKMPGYVAGATVLILSLSGGAAFYQASRTYNPEYKRQQSIEKHNDKLIRQAKALKFKPLVWENKPSVYSEVAWITLSYYHSYVDVAVVQYELKEIDATRRLTIHQFESGGSPSSSLGDGREVLSKCANSDESCEGIVDIGTNTLRRSKTVYATGGGVERYYLLRREGVDLFVVYKTTNKEDSENDINDIVVEALSNLKSIPAQELPFQYR